VDKHGNAQIFNVPIGIDRCLSRAVTSLLHDVKAHKGNNIDTGVVLDEPADKADSDAVESLLHFEVDERADKIEHEGSKGGNVECRRVEGETNGSDDGLPATSSPPATHWCDQSRAGITNHCAVTWLLVVSTCPNWLQYSDKLI